MAPGQFRTERSTPCSMTYEEGSMADNDGTRYTTRGETDKLSLIEDRLHSCLPVIAIAFRGGALFATSSTIRGVRKVRLVHPKGLVFAGTGEVVAIQQIATGFTTGAH